MKYIDNKDHLQRDNVEILPAVNIHLHIGSQDFSNCKSNERQIERFEKNATLIHCSIRRSKNEHQNSTLRIKIKEQSPQNYDKTDKQYERAILNRTFMTRPCPAGRVWYFGKCRKVRS